MIRRHLDLILLFILTTIVVVLSILQIDGGILMKLSGLIFVVFAPGYAVTAALFKEGFLQLPAKIALAIGISLSLSALGGIGLYATGAMLTRTSWTVFLAAVILGGSIAAYIRRSRSGSYTPEYVARKISISEIVLLTFSAIALFSGVYLAWTADKNQAYVPFTELWILPQSEDVSEIEIGLHNNEQADMVYVVSVQIDGVEVENWQDVEVPSGQEWSKMYTLPPQSASKENITVYLYTADNLTEPYRWGQINRE